jgi:hypothetical protein
VFRVQARRPRVVDGRIAEIPTLGPKLFPLCGLLETFEA